MAAFASIASAGPAAARGVLSHPTLSSYAMPGATSYVAGGPDGDMYVAAGNDVVQMSPRGSVVSTYGVPGTVNQLAPLGSSLYLSYAAGTVLAALPAVPGGPLALLDTGLPLSAGALAAGPDGNLYEGALGGIFKAHTDGQLVEYSTPQTPNVPNSIREIDSAYGTLWYTNPSTNKIGSITTSGHDVEYGRLSGAPSGITATSNGVLYFTEPSKDIVGRITTTGAITEWRTTIPSPTDLVLGPDGNLWVTGTKTIARVSPTGHVTYYKAGANNSGIAVGTDRASIWFATGAKTVDVMR